MSLDWEVELIFRLVAVFQSAHDGVQCERKEGCTGKMLRESQRERDREREKERCGQLERVWRSTELSSMCLGCLHLSTTTMSA